MKYRKRPVVIEAFQWTGGHNQREDPVWIVDAINRGDVCYQAGDDPCLSIKTLEGNMRAGVGDWIIKGIKGELYPCRNDIFRATYEPVGD